MVDIIDHRVEMLRMIRQHGTVTAAAEALWYSPSTVSAQVNQLGKELGAPLLIREGRRVRLTVQAEKLLDHVEVMRREWEHARADLESAPEQITGTFTMCGFSTAASVLLPPSMKELNHVYPGLRTRTVEADPERCFDMLLAGQADLGVVIVTDAAPAADDPRFHRRHILDDPLDLMVPEDHRLAAQSSVRLGDAAGEDWILGRPGGTYHQLVVSACNQAGFTLSVAHYADEWETGTALVAEGFGVCLVPRMARWPDLHPVVRVPLHGAATPLRSVMAFTRAEAAHRPTVRLALDALTLVAEEFRVAAVPAGQ